MKIFILDKITYCIVKLLNLKNTPIQMFSFVLFFEKVIQKIVLFSGPNLHAQGPHLHARGPQIYT